jgi:hypothetical protein
LPAATAALAPAPAPVVAGSPSPAPATRAVALYRGFQYPAAFLIPLPLLAGAIFLARLFTRDPLPLAAKERAA